MNNLSFFSKNNKSLRSKNADYLFILWAVLLASLPVLSAMVRLMATAHGFSEIWPIGSSWNDEAFYFKQTESIVSYGLPQGYFGYNESSAASLSFGAWAPIILIPGAIWGKLFGYGMLSPYIFNVVFLSLCLLGFGLLKKIGLADMSMLYLIFFSFAPLSRYMFSYMPEIMIIGLVVVLLGFFESSREKAFWVKDIFIFLILVYLVTIRPYLAVLFIMPALLSFERKGKKRIIYLCVTAVILVFSLASYSFVGSRFTAAYIGDIYTNWLDKMFTHGPRTVFNEIVDTLKNNLALLGFRMSKAVHELDAVGAYFLVFLAASALLLLGGLISLAWFRFEEGGAEERKAAKLRHVLFYSALFLSQAAVFFAILILYNIADGFRHLIVFLVIDVIIVCTDKKTFKSFKLLSFASFLCLFFIFFVVKSGVPESYAVPYVSEETDLEDFLSEKENIKNEMPLKDGISWDNTVDVLLDPESDLERFYLVPEGFGINLCEHSFLENNMGSLKAGYIIIPADDVLCQAAEENGYHERYRTAHGLCVFQK